VRESIGGVGALSGKKKKGVDSSKEKLAERRGGQAKGDAQRETGTRREKRRDRAGMGGLMQRDDKIPK